MSDTFPKPPRRDCPDCKVELRPIKILDATDWGGVWSEDNAGLSHALLAYAAADAERSFFTKTIQHEGFVQGMLCPDCGRILMYAMDK